MPTERFQPCKEQDQHLDQTNRDASPSKTYDFWRRQCQRHDTQQQEVNSTITSHKRSTPR